MHGDIVKVSCISVWESEVDPANRDAFYESYYYWHISIDWKKAGTAIFLARESLVCPTILSFAIVHASRYNELAWHFLWPLPPKMRRLLCRFDLTLLLQTFPKLVDRWLGWCNCLVFLGTFRLYENQTGLRYQWSIQRGNPLILIRIPRQRA